MASSLLGITRSFPSKELTNEDLNLLFPDWGVEKIASKTGIHRRFIADVDEFTSHLATSAAQNLFQAWDLNPHEVDALILVTQSPDYFLPTTACIVHENLGLREDASAVDVNMGCSGYIYGLSLASALIDSDQAGKVLLLTGDTYSKFLNEKDKSVKTIFGDGATASLIERSGAEGSIGKFVFGTDGSGAKHLIVPNGGLRSGEALSPKSNPISRNLAESKFDLFMDGPEIFNFTLRVTEKSLNEVLRINNLAQDDIDFFVFHQANAFMLDHLRKKLEIPEEKFPVMMKDWGNTVSSTIPMALVEMEELGMLQESKTIMLLGFGVGLSWGGTVIRTPK